MADKTLYPGVALVTGAASGESEFQRSFVVLAYRKR